MLRPGKYCRKPAGDCDGKGQCAWIPAEVLDYMDPVCGCDGNTHSNPTYAASRGVNVAHDGECPGAPLEASPPSPRRFDTRLVLGPLNDAAKDAGRGCYHQGDATGVGHAVVTFEASGRVSSVVIHGALAGTKVGTCIERHFRAVAIPPFEGKPVSVGKAFFVGPAVN
jgi:hypothetical protein